MTTAAKSPADANAGATTPTRGEDVQVYRVYIRATPEAIWDAITSPEWNYKYGYGGRSEYELRPGGSYKAFASEAMKAYGGPDVVVDGEVIESDAPRRLVQTWRALWDPEMVKEGGKRLTWEIAPGPEGVCTLTVTHELAGAPRTAAQVSGKIPEAGGGWAWILSDLKSLLETGKALAG
jgi:uncharacterized protein YndB with AHSA1/START domain